MPAFLLEIFYGLVAGVALEDLCVLHIYFRMMNHLECPQMLKLGFIAVFVNVVSSYLAK